MEEGHSQTPKWLKIAISIALVLLLHWGAAALGTAVSHGQALVDLRFLFLFGFFVAINALQVFDMLSVYLHHIGVDATSTEVEFREGEGGGGEIVSGGKKIVFHLVFLSISLFFMFVSFAGGMEHCGGLHFASPGSCDAV